MAIVVYAKMEQFQYLMWLNSEIRTYALDTGCGIVRTKCE
jgi:hypothetical protein